MKYADPISTILFISCFLIMDSNMSAQVSSNSRSAIDISEQNISEETFSKAISGNDSPSSSPVLSVAEGLRGAGLCFTPNKGQIADTDGQLCPDVLYKGGGDGADIYLRKTGISYVYSNMGNIMHEVEEETEHLEKTENLSPMDLREKKQELMQKQSLKIHRVDMNFVNCNSNVVLRNEDEVEGYTNYYYAHCPRGITNVKQYNKVTYKNIYNNIDLTYYGDKENGIKYDLIVQPHADPSQIKLHWKGAESIHLNSDGSLIIKTSVNEFTESIPKVYQVLDGRIVDVKARYILNGTTVSFELGTWNPKLPLIIDPWATYYSGSGMQSGSGLATDASGNVIFTGLTMSVNFPVSAGAFQMNLGGGTNGDAFLVKFSITGTRIFGTYFGGSLYDFGNGVAVDTNNDILLTGSTRSGNFPTKNPAGGAYFQAANGGGFEGDAFVAKFTTLGLLTWSTLYGGNSGDEGYDVITDAANNVVIVGYTKSGNFPTMAPYDATLTGASDAFAVKFNGNCVRQWATYLGGGTDERAYGVASDASNNFFLTGYTTSSNFPTLSPHQGTLGGSYDAFVTKLNGVSGFPIWSTYYGGSDLDQSMSIATDSFGNCIVAGRTQSSNNISSPGANQTIFGGGAGFNADAFIAKFNPSGARLWGTYHGGVGIEQTGGCAVDGGNNIYWYGEVEDDVPNPSWISICAYQNTYNGVEDQIISKFDPNGKLLCTTALGGPQEEDFDAGIVHPHYDIAAYGPFLYVTAHVRSLGYPVSPGAFQTLPPGGTGSVNAFVNQLCANICQQQFLNTNATASNTIICPNVPISFTSTVNNACDTTGLRFKWTFTGASPNSSTVPNPVISYSSPGFYSVKLVVSTPCQKDSVIKTNYIIVNPCTINVNATGASVCSNTNCTNITASGSSGTTPYTYSWSTGGTTATINVCPTANTTYTVMVTDANGNYAATTTSITVKTAPVLSTSSTNFSCTTTGYAQVWAVNGVATSNINPLPFTYSWSSGETTYYTYPVSAGNYTVTVNDGNGCTNTQVFTITGTNPLSASFTSSSTCLGSPVNFTNTGTPPGTGVTYIWRISPNPNTGTITSGTTTNFSYTFLSAGSYTITHQVDSGGCTRSTSKNIIVTNCTGPAITASGSSVCPGNCSTATASSSGGTGPYTYSWSTGATTQNISPCPASTTTYTVKVTDSGGNTATTTTTVTIKPPLTITSTPTNIVCSGGTGSASALGGNGSPPYTYNWSNGQTNQNSTGLSAGNYTVTVADATGCSASSTVVINSPLPLAGQFSTGTANCTACGCKEWIIVNATGGTSPYSYSWPDGYVNRYKNQLCPGAYTIKIVDKNGCSTNLIVNAP